MHVHVYHLVYGKCRVSSRQAPVEQSRPRVTDKLHENEDAAAQVSGEQYVSDSWHQYWYWAFYILAYVYVQQQIVNMWLDSQCLYVDVCAVAKATAAYKPSARREVQNRDLSNDRPANDVGMFSAEKSDNYIVSVCYAGLLVSNWNCCCVHCVNVAVANVV